MNRYYIYLEEVVGPYGLEEITPFLHWELQVCREGQDAWQRASEVLELAAILATPTPVENTAPPEPKWVEGPPEELPPGLKQFWTICRNADDELLKQQKKKNWSQYFANEKLILSDELERRGF